MAFKRSRHNPRNVVTPHASVKIGGAVGANSTIEEDLCLLMDFERWVKRFIMCDLHDYPKTADVLKDIEKRLKEGRCQGHGADYIPWIQVHEIPSWGQSSRIFGLTTRRIHHLFSRLERAYFYIRDWPPNAAYIRDPVRNVTDIREQYALLPLEVTWEIARKLGVKHPMYRGKPVVMTTDIVYDTGKGIKRQEHARSIKYANELLKERVQEKIEIERLYWNEYRHVDDCLVVTEEDIPFTVVDNIVKVHKCVDIAARSHLSREHIEGITDELARQVLAGGASVAACAAACDKTFGVPPGSALLVARHLIVTRQWEIDMTVPYEPRRTVSLLAINLRTARQLMREVR